MHNFQNVNTKVYICTLLSPCMVLQKGFVAKRMKMPSGIEVDVIIPKNTLSDYTEWIVGDAELD